MHQTSATLSVAIAMVRRRPAALLCNRGSNGAKALPPEETLARGVERGVERGSAGRRSTQPAVTPTPMYFTMRILTGPAVRQKYPIWMHLPPGGDEQKQMEASHNSTPDDLMVDVLVVDDDRDAVEELVEYLSKAKLRCQPAADGWAALQLLADGYRPQVVVTDLRMPELTGMEFAERLSRLGDAERPEIIFVSGNAGFDDAVAAIRLGARDMLTKPIDGPRLVRAVKSAQLARQMRLRADSMPPAQAATSAAKAKSAADEGPVARKR